MEAKIMKTDQKSNPVQIVTKSREVLAERMSAAGMSKTVIVREISFALQLISQDGQLQKCTPESLQSAIINIANIGLTLNPAAQEAALIARWNGRSNRTEATLMPQYRGLAKLACDNTGYVDIMANVVYEKDEFSLDIADTRRPITHRPYLKGDRGQRIGAYAMATDQNGFKKAEWVTIEDIEKIRNNSDAYQAYIAKKIKKTPWVDWFDEMARKSALKRLTKYLTGSTENEKLINAVELDNQDYQATHQQVNYIDTLLTDANISPERMEKIQREMYDYSYQEAKDCIEYLQNNQLNDVRYTGSTPTLMKGKSSARANVEAAVADEKR